MVASIIVLVGLPGSGKTTYRNNFLKYFPWYKVVSADDYVDNIAANESKTYSDIWCAVIEEAMEYFWEQLEEHVRNGKDIIIDTTSHTASSRKRLLKFIKQHSTTHYRVRAVEMPFCSDEWEERLKIRAVNTGKIIPEHVIQRMKDNYCSPSKSEGFDEVVQLND